MHTRDPKSRFSDRVADYIRYRPSYPEALIDFLEMEGDLQEGDRIADVGAGTGKLTELLLKRDRTTYAIEPNQEMRAAAYSLLSKYPNFQTLNGSAESIPLLDGEIRLLTIAQAFHWVDAKKFRQEAKRCLADGGQAAIIWNSRRNDLPFMRDYQQMLIEMVPEYELTREKSDDLEKIRTFFGHDQYIRKVFPYRQTFDWEGLQGRLMSASYCPKPSEPGHIPLMTKLRSLFDGYEKNGQITFVYDTVVYLGAIPWES